MLYMGPDVFNDNSGYNPIEWFSVFRFCCGIYVKALKLGLQ